MDILLSAFECGGTFCSGGLTWIRIFLLQTRGCVLSGAQLTDLTAVILSDTGEKITARGGQTCRGVIYICHNMTEYESRFVILYNYTLNL